MQTLPQQSLAKAGEVQWHWPGKKEMRVPAGLWKEGRWGTKGVWTSWNRGWHRCHLGVTRKTPWSLMVRRAVTETKFVHSGGWVIKRPSPPPVSLSAVVSLFAFKLLPHSHRTLHIWPSAHSTCGSFPPQQVILCHLSWVSMNSTKFW